VAIPRKQYPSDHRRWIRLYEDVLDDPKLQGDDQILASYVRILLMLNRTKSRDGSLRVSHAGLEAIMGRRRRDVALTCLSRLVHVGLTCAARYADYTLILVPKWPKLQGFAPAELRRDSGETPAPTPTPTPNKKRAEPAAPACWALEAAETLKQSVARRWPGAPMPGSLVGWARELERIKAAKHEVEAALLWYASKARDATPYLPECRSGRSFREKYDKVLAARKRGGVTSTSEASGKPRRYFEATPRVGGIENPGAAIGNLLRDAGVRS